jgi:hypothetical protein
MIPDNFQRRTGVSCRPTVTLADRTTDNRLSSRNAIFYRSWPVEREA